VKIKKGKKYRIFFNANNINNKMINVRAVVDDEIVVYRMWRGGWVYCTYRLSYLELLIKEKKLTEVIPKKVKKR